MTAGMIAPEAAGAGAAFSQPRGSSERERCSPPNVEVYGTYRSHTSDWYCDCE